MTQKRKLSPCPPCEILPCRSRLLVVDDIDINLKVAEGLLAPYQAAVDTCSSGKEAIELVKSRDYDIVFMDHLMPEMDGIETTAAIRSWENESNQSKQVPIIALTANAVVEMKEMFIENGFNDFLAKPIEVSKLDAIFHHWIPKEKIGGRSEELGMRILPLHFLLPNYLGVDVERGIAMTGGNKDLYKKVLAVFCKDVEKRLPLL